MISRFYRQVPVTSIIRASIPVLPDPCWSAVPVDNERVEFRPAWDIMEAFYQLTGDMYAFEEIL